MELIDYYQPEFVARFTFDRCACPACQNAPAGWPGVSVALGNQVRESLDLACEAAASAILLNPEAFNLHTVRGEPAGEETLSAWDEMLNQQCINLAVHPSMPVHLSLYAIGVLLSKAQRYRENDQQDPMLLLAMGDQLALLAQENILAGQQAELPPIMQNRASALKAMGSLRLNLDLPMVEKMSVMLRLSELAIMTPERLQERLIELEDSWNKLAIFEQQPEILRNFLLYPLYHQVFPGVNCENYGEAFLLLAVRYFRLRILCAIAVDEEGQITAERAVKLISALTAWEQQHPLDTDEAQTADYSLLCGLSLL